MKYSIVKPQVIKSRYESGVDYGAPRRVIMQIVDSPNEYLVIRNGFMQAIGARGFGQEYHPTALIAFRDLNSVDSFSRWTDTGISGGRFSKARLAELEPLIQKYYGLIGVAEHLRSNHTLMVER